MPLTRPRCRSMIWTLGAGLLLLAACDSGTPSPTPVVVGPTATFTVGVAAPTATAVVASPIIIPNLTATAPAAPPTTMPVTDTVPAPTTTVAAAAGATAPAPTAAAHPPTRVPTRLASGTPTQPANTATPGLGGSVTPAADTVTPGGDTPTPAGTATVAALLTPGRTPLSGADLQVERVAPGKGRIALTFDAGSTSGDVPAILAALARYNAHITFFVTGQWAEQNPEQVRAMLAAGDEVANHSYTHPSFPKLTDDEMISELAKADAAIRAAGATTSKPYWRPPFGDETGHVLNVARDQGYRSIYWTWDSLDSIGKPKSKDFIVKRVTQASVPLDGAVILQHVAAPTSVAALPDILTNLYGRGLRVVTITELLAP